MEIKKQCQYCGCSFIAHKMTTIYCSPSCNNKDYKSKIREKQITEYQSKNPDTIPVIKKSPLDDKQFLTPREAAKVLGVGKSTIYRELATGLIKAIQLKGKTLIRRKDIESLFREVVAFIMNVIDLTATLNHSVRNLQLVPKKVVNLFEKFIASVPCRFCLK